MQNKVELCALYSLVYDNRGLISLLVWLENQRVATEMQILKPMFMNISGRNGNTIKKLAKRSFIVVFHKEFVYLLTVGLNFVY